ncbi:unnamed protein product, partial [Rangifer tarandus platyrhynchus]
LSEGKSTNDSHMRDKEKKKKLEPDKQRRGKKEDQKKKKKNPFASLEDGGRMGSGEGEGGVKGLRGEGGDKD